MNPNSFLDEQPKIVIAWQRGGGGESAPADGYEAVVPCLPGQLINTTSLRSLAVPTLRSACHRVWWSDSLFTAWKSSVAAGRSVGAQPAAHCGPSHRAERDGETQRLTTV